MQICKVRLQGGEERAALLEGNLVRLLRSATLSEYLHAERPGEALRQALDTARSPLTLEQVGLLAPVDRQEVWAAGVTYIRSREARERESVGAAVFYDKVYSAARPELFFKAPASRVSGPGAPVHVRRDSKWSVPEPELALVISPSLQLVGFTIGNDMSARDIEGENPLYLPQAKMYDRACAVGPVITLAGALPAADQTVIRLQIERGGQNVFDGSTRISSMARKFEELIDWLGREMSFPDGALLLTGTGVVPPDDFTLQAGDLVHIDVTGIGRLSNPVAQRPA
jgi:2-dehydro-3-deoxy-D-arabinonate dehydratase